MELLDLVAPHYADDLAERSEELLRPVDMSLVPDLGSALYKHLSSKIGTVPEDLAKRATGFYHPSAVALDPFCAYDCIQSRLKVPGQYQKDPQGALRLDIGTQLHEVVQRYLIERFGTTGQAEVPLRYDPLFLAGHCDFILPLNGFEAVVEIKTKNSTAGMSKAVPWHKRQCHIYQFIRRAPVGIVLYVDLSTQDLLAFPHVFQFSVWQEVVDRILSMEAARLDNRDPTPTPHRYCPGCSSNWNCPSYQSRNNRYIDLEIDDD